MCVGRKYGLKFVSFSQVVSIQFTNVPRLPTLFYLEKETINKRNVLSIDETLTLKDECNT